MTIAVAAGLRDDQTGIVAYTKALSKQVNEKGVRANMVAPGPFWRVLQPSGGQPEEKVRQFGRDSNFGRPGQPLELAFDLCPAGRPGLKL